MMQALVTGAGRGIGLALRAELLAAGHQATGTFRKTRPAGTGWLSMDVTDKASVQAAATAFGEGPLDLLICNAGILPDRHETLSDGYPPEMWAETFAVNVTGVFLTVQAFLPSLAKSQSGRIAILSSQMGSSARAPGGTYAYRTSKAAVLNLGRNLASDLRTRSIAVGIYHPGWVRTDMGGAAAEIDAATSARNLVARFQELSIATTGCFRIHDGRDIPF